MVMVRDANMNAEDCLGILQHHDAITGTATTNVIHDYMARLDSAMDSLLLMKSMLIQEYVEKHFQLNMTDMDYED